MYLTHVYFSSYVLRKSNRETLNKCLSLSCFPFYRTSRGCRPRESGEMAESAQIRGELSAGFPGFLRNILEFLTRANRATGHVAVLTRVRERAARVSRLALCSLRKESQAYYADFDFSPERKVHYPINCLVRRTINFIQINTRMLITRERKKEKTVKNVGTEHRRGIQTFLRKSIPVLRDGRNEHTYRIR